MKTSGIRCPDNRLQVVYTRRYRSYNGKAGVPVASTPSSYGTPSGYSHEKKKKTFASSRKALPVMETQIQHVAAGTSVSETKYQDAVKWLTTNNSFAKK